MMSTLSESEESCVLLYRLVNLIKGFQVSKHEFNSDLPDEKHIFHEEILERRKSSPIIATVFDERLGTDLTNVKTMLHVLMKHEGLGIVSKESRSNTLTCASSIFKNYISTARYIQSRIMEIVRKLTEIHGFKETITDFERIASVHMRRPSTARRPYHIHFTETGAGGGDLNGVIQRLENEEHKERVMLFPVKSWRVSSHEWYHKSMVHYNSFFLERAKFDKCLLFICFNAFEIAKILEASAEEMEDVHHELVGWRMLPCAMALHKRLGKASLLGLIGSDVMKLVLDFI